MKEILSVTLALDLGNTNTVLAFQYQKDIKTTLVEIPNITSSPGVIPTAVWYDEPSKIIKIGVIKKKIQKEDVKLIMLEMIIILVRMEVLTQILLHVGHVKRNNRNNFIKLSYRTH